MGSVWSGVGGVAEMMLVLVVWLGGEKLCASVVSLRLGR